MVEISRNPGGIKVKGHAGYAEPGKDIVCAAVSVLVCTLIESITELTEDEVTHDIEHGNTEINYGIISEQAKLLIDSFFIGMTGIAETYPEYVRVVN